MSASSKKKVRKEQTAANMTEKQKAQKKESRNLKLASIAFFVVLALMVGLVLYTAVRNSGIVKRATTAVVIGEHKLNTVELNYFYIDSINSFLNTYGSYASLFGLDTSKPLDQQTHPADENATWADYFIEQAEQTAQSHYALYDAAMAAGHTLSAEEQEELEHSFEHLEESAAENGFGSLKSYIRAAYGPGASVKSYKQFVTLQTISSSYYSAYQDSLNFTDADLRAFEADKYNEYSSFSYASCYLPVVSFCEGGETDSDGNTTYTDAEKEAGKKAAKAAADELAKCATEEELDEAFAALSMNEGATDPASDKYTKTRYSSVQSTLRDWVTDEARKTGDTTVIENTSVSTNEDGTEETTTSGYYVVRFDSSTDNTFPLVNVRHILVSFEGGQTDESGVTTYSEDEMAAAKASAEALLAQWESGEATEASFAALATAETADTASKESGGLYEDVYPGQMVTNFNDWCFDESRKPGDTGIVESNYGYHVMYFSGNGSTTYRDYMINNELITSTMDSWYDSLIDAVTVTEKNVSGLNRSLTLSNSSAS